MCVPIFLQKFSVGREFFLSPTLNTIQPIFYHRRTYFNLQSFLHTLVINVQLIIAIYVKIFFN